MVSFILSNRDFLHPFHSRVLQGVEEYSEESGFFVIYTRFRYSATVGPDDLQLPSVLHSHGIADCVILAGANFETFTKSLNKKELLYVLLANNLISTEPGPPYDRVRFDDLQAQPKRRITYSPWDTRTSFLSAIHLSLVPQPLRGLLPGHERETLGTNAGAD